MPSPVESVTPNLLREWALPSGAESKYDRGRILVIGGSRKTPGAAVLAGLAALRVGAGRLTLAVGESVAVQVAVAVPESGVIGLPETPSGSVSGISADEITRDASQADAILIGSGLDHAGEALTLMRLLLAEGTAEAPVVIDAFALSALPELGDELEPWRGRMVLTPNKNEAARLLGREIETLGDDLARIADRYRAVVASFGIVAAPDGSRWDVGSGQAGLSTSGSGDVLAGAIAGILARGASPEQAACWGTHLHAAAGDRLAARIGPTGYLARELLDELPLVLLELGQRV
ncbi:MAG: yjeF-like protein hydroxyethylthiazole kinaserelated protein [Cryobacterium sp.]|nr:yjeF-like protein hydroxyethylthiazole kinaserelated protein [Cryobacterium sp.]